MVWLLKVSIDRDTLPEYNELIDELKKIPDVAVMVEYEQVSPEVSIEIYDLEKKYKKDAIITYDYEKGVVQLEIHDYKILAVIEERKASAENNEKAISLLVGFTRYALAKITKDIKYIKESETSREDITQIKPIDVTIITLSESLARPIMESLNLTANCEIIKSYTFHIWYVYPQTARAVSGYIFCCPDRCYLYVTSVSQGGVLEGDKRFVIYLNGREPTIATLKDILKTRTDLLMDIERYIRETLKKRKES